ncbi:MAG: DMT family transporter [Anaerolineae bacterium]|nr:DMT family transporter [Anaerolineae bacterium]
MTGEAAALLSAFLGTLASVILKREVGKISALVVSASRGLVASVFYFALLPFFGGFESFRAVPPAILALLVLSSIIGQVVGDTLYFRAIVQFGVARTMPIVSSYPLITTLLAVTILGEPLGWRRIVGVVLVVGGLMALTQQPGTRGSLHRGRRVGWLEPNDTGGPPWLIFAPAVISGINIFLLKPITQYMNPVMINCVRQPLLAVVMTALVLRRRIPVAPDTGQRRYLGSMLVAHLLGAGLSSFLFLLGIQLAGAARGGTLASTGPLFALLLAPLLLGEQVRLLGVLGSLLTVGGVWLLL